MAAALLAKVRRETRKTGGRVLPENAASGLAAAREIAESEGISIPTISTGATHIDSTHYPCS